MPISFAPQSDAQIIEFLVLCLENSGKTDFEEVAKHSKLTKNASAAYKKLWEMKRKFRAQQSDKAGSSSSSANSLTTPKSPTRVTKPRSSRAKKSSGDQ